MTEASSSFLRSSVKKSDPVSSKDQKIVTKYTRTRTTMIMMVSLSKFFVAAATIGSLVGQIHGEKTNNPPRGDVRDDLFSNDFLANLLNNHASKDVNNNINNVNVDKILKGKGFASELHDRELQSTRACNEQFSVATTAEMLNLVGFFLGLVLGPDSPLLAAAQAVIVPAIQFDIAAIKVCLSCDEIESLGLLDASILSDDSEYGFLSYCASDFYGYTASHSALVLAPIDPATGEIFTGRLRSFIAGHGVLFETDQAPSDMWPISVSGILDTDQLSDADKLFIFADTLAGSIAASAGAITIVPDYIGYGASTDFDRTFLTPRPYMQSYVNSFVAAKRFISAESNGCAVLDDVATVTGYSEGGYSSVVGALALEQNGVEILSAHSGGTPWDLDTQFGFSVGLLDSGNALGLLQQFSNTYSAYAYSNDFPFLANANTGVNVLSAEYSNASIPAQNVIDWFAAPDPLSVPEIAALLPANNTDLLNPDLLALYRSSMQDGGGLNACTNGIFVTSLTQPVCDAFLDGSLLDVLANDVSFDLTVCHSPNDDLVGFAQVPDLSPDNGIYPNNIQAYQPLLSPLAPVGGHNEAFVSCVIDPVFKIATSLMLGANSPTFMLPLMMPPTQCLPIGEEPSDSPSEAPSETPSETPSEMPSMGPTSCAAIFEECETEDDCCSGGTCILRRIGQPKLCSSLAVRNRPKNSVAGFRGGRAGRVKIGG